MSSMDVHRTQTRSSQALPPDADIFRLHKAKILVALRLLGAGDHDVMLPETQYLAQLLHEDEVLLGVVFGKIEKEGMALEGRGLLVITNRRILLLDKKPSYVHADSIKFEMVRGVKYEKAMLVDVITIHTHLGDITLRTFNDHCARQFVQVVEDMLSAKGRGWGLL